jgi:hypothetical protein
MTRLTVNSQTFSEASSNDAIVCLYSLRSLFHVVFISSWRVTRMPADFRQALCDVVVVSS